MFNFVNVVFSKMIQIKIKLKDTILQLNYVLVDIPRI